MSIPRLSRRSVLTGGLVTVASAVVGYAVARGSSAAGDRPVTAAANDYGPKPLTTESAPLAAVNDVPAGGGLVLSDAGVVLVRDESGVRAFSAICTHQGCPVGSVAGGRISCPCHGSEFDATTGAVRAAPATRPLPRVAVTVRGDFVYRA